MTFDADHLTTSASLDAATVLVSRSTDPANFTFSAGTKYYLTPAGNWTTTTTDFVSCGEDCYLIPVRLRFPASGSTSLENGVEYEFHDGTTNEERVSDLLSPTNREFQDIMDNILGDQDASASSDGKSVENLRFFTENVSGGDVTADHDAYRVRGFTMVRGDGAAP